MNPFKMFLIIIIKKLNSRASKTDLEQVRKNVNLLDNRILSLEDFNNTMVPITDDELVTMINEELRSGE